MDVEEALAVELFLGDVEGFLVDCPEGLDDLVEVPLGLVPGNEELGVLATRTSRPRSLRCSSIAALWVGFTEKVHRIRSMEFGSCASLTG